jgi:hypothetical protein
MEGTKYAMSPRKKNKKNAVLPTASRLMDGAESGRQPRRVPGWLVM